MNNVRLSQLLKDYPVTVCAADQLRVIRGQFVIANTDTSGGPGKHWVGFYFPERRPFEFFDSLGENPTYYGVGFEDKLGQPYRRLIHRVQSKTSDTCGHYCVYYVAERSKGRSMADIVSRFNVKRTNKNDNVVRQYVEDL